MEPVRLGAEWTILGICWRCGRGVPIRLARRNLPFDAPARDPLPHIPSRGKTCPREGVGAKTCPDNPPGRYYGRCENCEKCVAHE